MKLQNRRLEAKLWLSMGLRIAALAEQSAAAERPKDPAMRLAGMVSRFQLDSAAH